MIRWKKCEDDQTVGQKLVWQKDNHMVTCTNNAPDWSMESNFLENRTKEL